jgi:hypothetical protein
MARFHQSDCRHGCGGSIRRGAQQQFGKVLHIGVLETTSQALKAANLDAFRQGCLNQDISNARTSSSNIDLPMGAKNGSLIWRWN